MQDVAMEFREKIRLLLAREGINQATLVERLDGAVSKSTVWNWHQGTTVPTLDVALKLSRMFDVPLEMLADDSLDLGIGSPRRDAATAEQAASDARRFTLELIEKMGDDIAQRRLMCLDWPTITPVETVEETADEAEEKTKPASSPTPSDREGRRKNVAG